VSPPEASMMRRVTAILATLALFLGGAGLARADIITFDDVVSNSGSTQVPNSWDHQGLNFSSSFFQGVWGDLNEQGARNGTPVFIYGYSTQTIRTTDNSPFSLEQLDIGLSFYTQSADNVTVTLNFAGGGSSSFNLALTQNFQTLILNASNL